jgi:crotonobetainyl-CoA:carnitine CoA-transferase CaiB-like acyl-CoA transferase
MVAGSLAAVAVLGALVRRKEAVYIDVPIVQSLLSWMVVPMAAYTVTGKPPSEGHSLMFGSTPYYNLYRTSDGKYMAVAAIEDDFWHNLVTRLGVPGIENKRFGAAPERRRVASALRRAFASKTRDEWTRLLAHEDTCASPVLSVEEALNSEWARASSSLAEVEGSAPVLNSPMRTLPPMRGRPYTAAPSLGKDTDQVMKGLGYGKAEISRLKRRGVLE